MGPVRGWALFLQAQLNWRDQGCQACATGIHCKRQWLGSLFSPDTTTAVSPTVTLGLSESRGPGCPIIIRPGGLPSPHPEYMPR
jgi:hypothetical protein